jgi:hypothetical protein
MDSCRAARACKACQDTEVSHAAPAAAREGEGEGERDRDRRGREKVRKSSRYHLREYHKKMKLFPAQELEACHQQQSKYL